MGILSGTIAVVTYAFSIKIPQEAAGDSRKALDEAPGEAGSDPGFVIVKQPQADPLGLIFLINWVLYFSISYTRKLIHLNGKVIYLCIYFLELDLNSGLGFLYGIWGSIVGT